MSKLATLLSQRRNRQSFSLTELLIVIAILIILISMLQPSLRRALSMAESAHCRNNLQKLSATMAVYADDNDEIIVARGTVYGGHKYWPTFLTGQQGTYFWGGAYQNGTVYMNPGPTFGCPSTPIYDVDKNIFGKGSAAKAYGLSHCGKIQFDHVVYKVMAAWGPSTVDVFRYHYGKINSPEAYILHTDSLSMWNNAKRMTASVMNHSDNLYKSRIHLLHVDDMANVSYFDGHVGSGSITDLNTSASNHRYFFDRDGNSLPVMPNIP